jgi:thiamine kinase-like enzyme
MCTYISGNLHGQINTEYRGLFEDDFGIVFTHCDLHHMNIMVNTDAELLALVDWEQAGWMPSYWKWCRSEYFWFHLHRPS